MRATLPFFQSCVFCKWLWCKEETCYLQFHALNTLQWNLSNWKQGWLTSTAWSVQIRSYFWSVFSCIRTEYEDLLRKSPYSVRIKEKKDQKYLRIWTLFTLWSLLERSFSQSFKRHFFLVKIIVIIIVFRQGVILPFLMKYDPREIYFFREPRNLIFKKMHKFIGPKIDKKRT